MLNALSQFLFSNVQMSKHTNTQTQVSIGRNEKMAAFETNWVILSIHSYTAWAMALIFHHHHHYLINFLDHVHYHHHYFINTLDHVHHHHHNINHPHDGLLEDRHLELLLLGVKLPATCDTPQHVQHQHLVLWWPWKILMAIMKSTMMRIFEMMLLIMD